MEGVRIQSKDLDCGYVYSIQITHEQAQAVLDAEEDELISLGREGTWIHVKHDAILVRSGSSGGTSALSKSDVIDQIEDQLD